MPTVGRWLKVRCFIEGVEVPVIATNISAQADSPMTAVIQIPPCSQGLRLLPRSVIHVFFHDIVFEGGNKGLNQQVNNLAPKVDASQTDDSDMSNYKLVFCGEYMGVSWTKTPTQRSLALQCMDLSNYWDYAYQWNNTDLFGPGYKAMFTGGGTNLFTDFLYSPGEMLMGQITYGIRSGSVQYPALKGLLGGVIRILEKISGCYFDPNDRKYRGANPFFALAELRLHITQMITAYDKDPTAQRLLGGSYDGMFGRALGNLGDQVSIRQAINALTPMIFHQTYPQPCPFYKVGSNNSISGEKRVLVTEMESAVNYQLVSLVDSLSTQLSELSTALSVTGTSTQELRNRISDIGVGATSLSRLANKLTQQGESGVKSAVTAAASAVRAIQLKLRTGITNKKAKLSDLVGQIGSTREKVRNILQMEYITSDRKTSVPSRLSQQIFRPDIWFGAPPKCNVIFPEHYTHMDFSRNFMAEPTRLLLKTNEEFYGEDPLLDKLYFAPTGQLVRQGDKAKGNLWAMFRNDLMSHELYTGVLPVFEKMGEFNIFAARSGAVNGTGSKIGMAQRSTNFLFFQKRYASRTMSMNARFLPYLAVGFPALIIDKHMDVDTLLRHRKYVEAQGKVPTELAKYFGVHFLGNVAQVTHSLDQGNGGVTSVQFTMAREHNEQVDLLGNAPVKESPKKDNNTRDTVMAGFTAPKVGDIGPNKGEITQVALVTSQHKGEILPLYTSRMSASQTTQKVQVGVLKQVKEYPPEIQAWYDSPKQYLSFDAYRITERPPSYQTDTQDMPFEEYMRPGWFGDCWHPGNIGRVYEDFFGIGSITDQLDVVDRGEGSESVNNNAEGMPPSVFSLPQKTSTIGKGKDAKQVNYVCIQDAVQFLLQVYSYTKQNNLNVDDFITSYTWRPIATMYDLFGSADLQYDPATGKPTQGVEGFHSRAFGQFEDVTTLLPPEIMEAIGVKKGDSSSPFFTRGDTRKRKQDAVLEMASALMYSRAVLG